MKTGAPPLRNARFLILGVVCCAAVGAIYIRAANRESTSAAPSATEVSTVSADPNADLESSFVRYQQWIDGVADIPDDLTTLPMLESATAYGNVAQGELSEIFGSPPSVRADAAVLGTVTEVARFMPLYSDIRLDVEQWVALRDGPLPEGSDAIVRQPLSIHPLENKWQNGDAGLLYSFSGAFLLPGDRVLILLMKQDDGTWLHMGLHGTWRVTDGLANPDLGPGYAGVGDTPKLEDGQDHSNYNAQVAWKLRYRDVPVDQLITEIRATASSAGWQVASGTEDSGG